jgi:ribosomal-protein-alanine N-acetyltransferase
LISTARLVVRRFAADDLAGYLGYQSDPVVRAHVPGAAMTDERARRYLAEQSVLDERETGSWHGFAVELAAGRRLIGDIGVFLQVDPEHTGDVGFQFDPAHHGRGYAHEAMAAFLPYLFRRLALRTVTAGCDPANTASQALMKRLGMHFVPGTAVQYQLTRDEWAATAVA